MNRIYRGWIFNPTARGGWKAERKGVSISANDVTWIMREIDRVEYDKLRKEEE